MTPAAPQRLSSCIPILGIPPPNSPHYGVRPLPVPGGGRAHWAPSPRFPVAVFIYELLSLCSQLWGHPLAPSLCARCLRCPPTRP